MNKLFLLTTLLTLSSQSFGESVSKKTDKYALVSANSALETLLEIPEVKTQYDECVKEKSSAMAECVWRKVSLNGDLKKQVLEKYNKLSVKEDKQANRAPASEKTDKKEEKENEAAIAAKKLNLATNYADDPQVQALTAFYKKRLNEVLTPTATSEDAKKQINSVDHYDFIRLYESELGKTIINAFTTYCLETNTSCGEITEDEEGNKSVGSCNVPENSTKREENRKANLANLKESGTSLESGSAESNKWQYCISQVSEICSKSTDVYSRNRSCLIVDYVKSARENLIAVNAQKEFWNSEHTKNKLNIHANFNNPIVDTDKLTEITSKDVIESSKKVDEERIALMDRCLTVEIIDGKEVPKLNDAEACKSFMSTNKEENEKALVEFTLRQEAQASLLEEKLASGDATTIEAYLKQEGYNKEQITAILTNKNPVEISDMITERFKNEKAALIKEMNERVSTKTSKEEGQITEADITNLVAIKKELSSRTNDLVQSVQFNNIVSSYLTIRDENKEESEIERNVASLFAEVESMENKEESKALLEKLKEAKIEKTEKSSVTLGIKNLNDSFLRYFENQSKKKDDKKK